MTASCTARIVFSAISILIAFSDEAVSQPHIDVPDATSSDGTETATVDVWALSKLPSAGVDESRWPDSCDLRDATPIAPMPYCGGDGGLVVRPGVNGSSDLLGFLGQTAGHEDIVWLDFDDPSYEVGRCTPDGLPVIAGMAYNDGAFCGSGDTLFAAHRSAGPPKVFELSVEVGPSTSNRMCSPEDPGESVIAGDQTCDVLREFSISQRDDAELIGALAVATPPSLGRTVLAATVGLDLIFMVPNCVGGTLSVIHECRVNKNMKGLAWLGGDRFLVANHISGRMDIINIAARNCETVGTFHAPSLGRVGGAMFDRERQVLYLTEAASGALYAVSLDPTDLDPVAIAEPDAIEQCGIGSFFFVDARGSCDPDEGPQNLNYTWTTPDGEEHSGAVVRLTKPPVGTYTYELEVDDGRGNSDTDLHEVTVIDTQAPRIVRLAASPDELWPPNGRFVPVTVDVEVDEACDPEPRCMIVDVESSDPSSNGETDWEILSDFEVALRAERDGTGDRTYTVTVECRDESGNISDSRTALVHVPHNDAGSTCACWSREELKSIAPNPDTESWSQTCQRGDDILPDSDRIRRLFGRSRHHWALAQSGDVTGEYSCQYLAVIPDQPRVSRYRRIDAEAYEVCRDQIRLRHTILGIADECTTN